MLAQLSKNCLIQLFLILFSFSEDQAQVLTADSSFGEGIVTIGGYTFSPNDTTSKDPVSILQNQNYYSFTYFIKGTKILRNDDSSLVRNESVTSTIHDSTQNGTVNITVTPVHPVYLIDWTTQRTYNFFKKQGAIQVIEKTLKNDSSEIFYRLTDSLKASVTFPDGKDPVMIANRECFKGNATVANGDDFIFYYSASPAKVHSPLNKFLPANFPYEVFRIDTKVTWSTNNGKGAKGDIIFQILEIKETHLPDNLFQIPNLSKENIRRQEVH